MRIIRDYQFVKSSDKGASVAVGNFDGVHEGHRYLLRQLINCKKNNEDKIFFEKLLRKSDVL